MATFDSKNVLIVNTFGIGDVLFTTPLIKNIKQHASGLSVGYVANARTADILKDHPLIDDVFVYERDEFHELYHRSWTEFLKKAKGFLDTLKEKHYDTVLDLSMNMPTGFLMMMAGIPKRIGFDYNGRGKFLTNRIPFKGFEGKHVVEFYCDLLTEIGVKAERLCMDFPMSAGDRKGASDILEHHQLNGRVVVLVPGGGASWGKDAARKQWAAEKFAVLADQLTESCGAKIILCGGPSDKSLSQKISGLMKNNALDFTGKFSLGESGALFSKAQVVIANDGGPLHMAVAAGAKTVSIFGPVDERVYGPYPQEGHRAVFSNIACRPCYRRFRVAECDHISCLRDLPVEKVFNAVKQIL